MFYFPKIEQLWSLQKRDQKVIGETLLLSTIKLENFKKVELDIIWNPYLNLKKLHQHMFAFSSWNLIIYMREGV